jgi:hypothetical protein
MVIPFGAPEVAHLIHQGLQVVVHGLWVLALVESEPTELPLDRLPLGDFSHCWDHASSPKVLQKETASAEAART